MLGLLNWLLVGWLVLTLESIWPSSRSFRSSVFSGARIGEGCSGFETTLDGLIENGFGSEILWAIIC